MSGRGRGNQFGLYAVSLGFALAVVGPMIALMLGWI